MAGSHRAAPTGRTGGRGRTLGVVAIVAAVIAGALALNQARDRDPDPSGTRTPAAPSTSLPTVTLTPTPTRTPTRKPTHASSQTARRLATVAPSAPKRLVISGVLDVGFDSTITPRNGKLRAASTAEVARWGDRGTPASPGRDTVFVVGKVVDTGAFERLPKVRRGGHVMLRTLTGRLTYTVQAIAERRAAGLVEDRTFAKRVPGRLQLVGIRYDARGEATGRVLVVTAVLTRARAGT